MFVFNITNCSLCTELLLVVREVALAYRDSVPKWSIVGEAARGKRIVRDTTKNSSSVMRYFPWHETA